MNEVNIKDEAQKIVRGLASALKLSPDSLCFCGIGKTYGSCCQNATADKLVPAEKEFEAALKYKDSQGGRIVSVPVGLLNQFLQKGINKLPCLYKSCTAKPVACHLVPENILKASFGSHCLDYKMRDGTVQSEFVKAGVGIAGTIPVFCSKHDNELFREIDTLGDTTSSKQQFLLALKAVAFSLRKTQILLSLDSQVEIFKPVLIIRSGTTSAGQHYTININHLSEQYIRFRTAHVAFQHFVDTLEKKDWDSCMYLQRNIKSESVLFYSAFINPSHDLEKQRINTPHTPVHLTLNVLARDGVLHAFFACPNDGSKEAYAALFDQLKDTNDQTLAAVINTILTDHPEGLLLPDGFTLSNDDHSKMKALRVHAKECLVSSTEKIFDLTDTGRSVGFVQSSV